MKRDTRIVSVRHEPLIVFKDDLISDTIVQERDFWEHRLFERWKQYLPRAGLVLDLGANIGNHVVMFKHYFPELTIWAFEPFFESFCLLRENTAQYDDVSCLNVGVGKNTALMRFSDSQEKNAGMFRCDPNGNHFNLVVNLSILNFPSPIKLIKIDVQGMEKAVLEGSVDVINRDKPLIWLENNDGDAIAYLQSLHYRIVDAEGIDYLMAYNESI